MATFAELVADVKVMTNRPDLDADIKQAVKAATLKMHRLDYFPRDLVETGIQWTTPDYLQSLDYKTLFPLWRGFKYLRKYDATTTPGTAGKFFTFLSPEKVVDGYGIDRIDICYLAGASINIRSGTQDQYMLIGYYANPDVAESTYDSWIARDHPYAIEFEAKRQIFQNIGFQEQASQTAKDVDEQIALLKISEVTGIGY